MQQNATESTLSPKQQKILDALLCGQSVTDAANAGGVDRSTVHRWLRDDYVFRAELNHCRSLMRDELHNQMSRLFRKAMAVVEKALDSNDMTAALAVLRKVEFFGPFTIGATDAEKLESDDCYESIFAAIHTDK